MRIRWKDETMKEIKEGRKKGGQLVKERNLRKIRRYKEGNSKYRKEGRQEEGFCASWFTFWRSSTDVSLFYTPLLLKGFVFACYLGDFITAK